jgi:hypothetical protein
MKNNILILDNNINLLRDIITSKYLDDFKTNKRAKDCINDIYEIICDIIYFNKPVSEDLTEDEFQYIYELNSKLEYLEEEFEHYIYNPNYSKKLNTKEKVFNYRKIMIKEMKNNLNIIINKKKFYI